MITLYRDDETDLRTLGAFFDGETRIVETLELPWRGNEHNVSCIPPGSYNVEWMWSPHHEKFLYQLTNVPGRGYIEIHTGNTVADTKGCILAGTTRDGNSIRSSVLALARFEVYMKGVARFALEVVSKKYNNTIVA